MPKETKPLPEEVRKVLNESMFMTGGNTDSEKDYYANGFTFGYHLASDRWVKIEDGLPDEGKSVEVVTLYLDKSNGQNKECSDRFIGYMDEYGELIELPADDEYGWKFNDCVTMWRYLSPLPNPPKQ